MSAGNRWAGQNQSSIGPALEFVEVTPSDSAEPTYFRGVYVGVAGDLALEGADGVVAVFRNVPAGSVIPVIVTRILATGTTASAIIGLT